MFLLLRLDLLIGCGKNLIYIFVETNNQIYMKLITTARVLACVLCMTSLCTVLEAQKKFKFERESIFPQGMKEFVFPSILPQMGASDTYKYTGTSPVYAVSPKYMPSIKRKYGQQLESGDTKYTFETYFMQKPRVDSSIDFAKNTSLLDNNAGYCVKASLVAPIACRILDESGAVLAHFTVLSEQPKVAYVGQDDKDKKVFITDIGGAKRFGLEESAGNFRVKNLDPIREGMMGRFVGDSRFQQAWSLKTLLLGDDYDKMQYLAIPEKLQQDYPAEAALTAEAIGLYHQWFQTPDDQELKAKLKSLGDRFALLDVEGKSVDYNFYVSCSAALCYSMAQELPSANKYGILAEKSDPNYYKPTVLRTIRSIYTFYKLRELFANRETPEQLIDIARGVAELTYKPEAIKL